MPRTSVISEGNTTNEAIEKGLKILNVAKNQVNIKILESEEKRSFFSILAPRVVKVELTLKENIEQKETIKKAKEQIIHKEKTAVNEENNEKAKKNVEQFFKQVLPKIGNNITYKINKNEFGLNIAIDGKDAGILIGYRGETLYAFQSVISAIANKDSEQKISVILDIENYKEKREKTLQDLAIKVAKTVEKTKKSVTLEPMQAYERKIIHSALQNSTTVKTESMGEEPKRRIVISLK